MRGFLAGASLLVVSGAAQAHPHDHVEQQALLSIGLDRVVLQVRIVPSYIEGAAIYAHIDDDGDGHVSDDEAAAFAENVISKTRMTLDANEIAFEPPSVKMPDRKSVSSGLGVIEVDAKTSIELTATETHILAFDIAFEAFSHDWFVQPFFFESLDKAVPSKSVERSESSHGIAIAFSPASP